MEGRLLSISFILWTLCKHQGIHLDLDLHDEVMLGKSLHTPLIFLAMNSQQTDKKKII